MGGGGGGGGGGRGGVSVYACLCVSMRVYACLCVSLRVCLHAYKHNTQHTDNTHEHDTSCVGVACSCSRYARQSTLSPVCKGFSDLV